MNSTKSEAEVTAMMTAFSRIYWGEECTEQLSHAISTAGHYVYTLAQAPLDPRDEEPFVFETGAHVRGAGL